MSQPASTGETVQFQRQFLSTHWGAVKLIQLLCGAFANIFHNWYFGYRIWVAAPGFGSAWLLNVITPFLIITFWLNVLRLLLHLLNLNNVWSRVNWRMGELIYCVICTLICIMSLAADFYWATAGLFVFNLFMSGLMIIMLCLSFAAEAFLIFANRTDGVVVWRRNTSPTA